jgi:hypothetical protein
VKNKRLFFLISVLVFAYVLIRAIVLGVTYDEAWTINTFVPLTLRNIFLFNPCDANNQILNTLLIKACFAFDKHSLFIARLPNVLAFVIFAYFNFKIVNGLSNKFLGISLFIILILNPFVLDFFSLARGYGLALAFQAGSIYYVLQFNEKIRVNNFVYSLLFGVLATLSNFTFLYFFIAVLFTGNLIHLFKYKFEKEYYKVLLSSLILTILTALFIYLPLTKLIKNGGLYYGGNTGFYSDTLVSLFSFTLYRPYNIHPAHWVLNSFLEACALLLVFYIYSRVKSGIRFILNKELIIVLLTGIVLIVNIINHLISHTLFLTDRTALLYYPLIIMSMTFLADGVKSSQFKIPSLIIIVLTIVFSLINFTVNANFVKTIAWTFDAHTENILDRINSIGLKEKRIETLDFSWPFESSVNYYLNKKQYSNVRIVKDVNDRENLNRKANYYIYYNKSLDKVGYACDKQIIRSIRKDTAWIYKKEDIYVFTNLDTISGGRK